MNSAKQPKDLNFLEGLLVSDNGVGVGDETAQWGLAVGVILHVECNGSAGLGATTDMVELEAHEGFDQSALAVSLVTNDKHRRRVEWGVEFLSQTMQLIVGLV